MLERYLGELGMVSVINIENGIKEIMWGIKIVIWI